MKPLPRSEHGLVLRTDFSDEAAWQSLCRAMETPDPVHGFRAYVDFVDDPAYDWRSRDDWMEEPVKPLTL